MHKNVQKTITKRNHKKIDFDRYNIQLKKMKEKIGDREDERKIVRMQNTVESANTEYENVNCLLKSQLPIYLHKRMEFMDPILEAMVFFQESYFSLLAEFLAPMASRVDMSSSAIEGYRMKRESGLLSAMENISIIKGFAKQSSLRNFSFTV